MHKTKRISIRLSETTHEKIKTLAAQKNMTINGLTEKLIEDAVRTAGKGASKKKDNVAASYIKLDAALASDLKKKARRTGFSLSDYLKKCLHAEQVRFDIVVNDLHTMTSQIGVEIDYRTGKSTQAESSQ